MLMLRTCLPLEGALVAAQAGRTPGAAILCGLSDVSSPSPVTQGGRT